MKNLLVVFCILVAGCAIATREVGREFDASKTDHIILGQSTEADVRALLGTPNQVKTMSDGTKQLGYFYARGRGVVALVIVQGTASGARVTITIGKDGKVTAIDKTSL